MGGCCPGVSPGQTAHAQGELSTTGPPPCGTECLGEIGEGKNTAQQFTRDVLCSGEKVPAGQGYWRGDTPYNGIYPDTDLVTWCDFATGNFKMMLVDSVTGCLVQDITVISWQCEPFMVVGTIGTSDGCLDGCVPDKIVTVTA